MQNACSYDFCIYLLEFYKEKVILLYYLITSGTIIIERAVCLLDFFLFTTVQNFNKLALHTFLKFDIFIYIDIYIFLFIYRYIT